MWSNQVIPRTPPSLSDRVVLWKGLDLVEHTERFISRIATSKNLLPVAALTYDQAKEYVMSISTVAIVTKLKIFLLNLSLELKNNFLNLIIKKYHINF